MISVGLVKLKKVRSSKGVNMRKIVLNKGLTSQLIPCAQQMEVKQPRRYFRLDLTWSNIFSITVMQLKLVLGLKLIFLLFKNYPVSRGCKTQFIIQQRNLFQPKSRNQFLAEFRFRIKAWLQNWSGYKFNIKIANISINYFQYSEQQSHLPVMDPNQHSKQSETTNEHHEGLVSSSNEESIHYEDGKIQKKVYGGGDASTLKEIYIHLIEKEKQSVETLIVNVQTGLTLREVSVILQEKAKIAINNLEVKSKLEAQPADLDTSLSSLLENILDAKPQLYFFFDETKAIIKQKVLEVKYEPLTKYSFLDDKSKVKVYIELQGIGKVAADKITSRFLQWSIEIKIHDYKGKNWIFAVPKTQCLLRPKESKVIQKENRLIISIAKNAEADNWFSLYKVKCVGERDE